MRSHAQKHFLKEKNSNSNTLPKLYKTTPTQDLLSKYFLVLTEIRWFMDPVYYYQVQQKHLQSKTTATPQEINPTDTTIRIE